MALDQNALNDLFGDAWGEDLKGDLEMDDSGELVFGKPEESEESEDSNDLNEDESEETDAEDSEDEDSEASGGEDDSESGDSDIDPVESRFQALESSVDKLTDLLESIAGKLTNSKPKEKEEIEDDTDFEEEPLTKKALTKLIKDVVSEAVQPLNRESKEQKEVAVVNSLLTKHGEEFKASVPAMKELLAINPDMGVAKAWEMVQKIRGTSKANPNKTTNQNSDGKKPVKKTGQAADLRNKAANLNTAKGVSGSGKDKKRAVGIEDIIKSSWSEVFE